MQVLGSGGQKWNDSNTITGRLYYLAVIADKCRIASKHNSQACPLLLKSFETNIRELESTLPES
jgi:hypothetical protein